MFLRSGLGSPVRIVSGYGLDDRAIVVRSPAEAKRFFLSSPALGPIPPIQWVPGVLSPGLKRGRGVTLITHPHLMPRSRMSRSYTPLPQSASLACSGTALALRSYETMVSTYNSTWRRNSDHHHGHYFALNKF
jgi:hypothetical protein